MIESLQEILRSQMNDESIIINEKTVFQTDLGLDSYNLVELICEVEERFNVEIPDREIKNLKTVESLINYISSK